MKAHFKLTMAALAVCGWASTAHAANYTLSPTSLVSGETYTVVNKVAPGVVDDTIAFSISSNSNVAGSSANLPLSLSFWGTNLDVLDITNLKLTLENTAGSILASVNSPATLSYSNLAPGNYDLVVSGVATGLSGGEYGVGVNVSAVPIPAAVVLFGSGLVGLGMAGRRKKAAQTA